MLSKNLHNKTIIIGLTSIKYNSSLASYIRFMAKSHGLNSKNLTRIQKIQDFSKEYKFLVKGPTMLLYSMGAEKLSILDNLQDLLDLNVIFISIHGYIFLSETIDKIKSIIEYKANINLSIFNLLCNLDITYSYKNLVILLDAYSKSIIKRS